MLFIRQLAIGLVVVGLLLLVFAELRREDRLADDIDRARQAAVVLARDGQYDESLKRLDRLWRAHPDHSELLWDKIAVLSWAGRHQRALELGAELDVENTPDWVLVVLNDAARSLQAASSKKQLADTGKLLDKNERARQQAVLLAREGQYDEAIAQLQGLRASEPDNELLIWDQIAILGWSGQYGRAVKLAAKMDLSQAPDWVVQSLNNSAMQFDVRASSAADQPDSSQQQERAVRAVVEVVDQAPPSSQEEAAEDVDAWLAREIAEYREHGDTDFSIRRLRTKLSQHPKHLGLRGDLAVIQAESGSYRDAIDTASEYPWREYPSYVLVGLGAAARRAGDTDTAQAIYEAGRHKYPADDRLLAGWLMTLADRDHSLALARDHLERIAPTRSETLPLREATAYLLTREQRHAAAAWEYQELIRFDPESAYYQREHVFALRRAGHPELAVAAGRRYSCDFTPDEWAMLLADKATFHVRQAEVQKHQSDGEQWFWQAQFSLDESCRAADAAQQDTLLARCHADRLVLLTAWERDREAINYYELRQQAGEKLPAYAHYAAAGAYLRRQQLAENIRALDASGEQVTGLDEAMLLMTLERHGEAEDLLRREQDIHPVWVWGADSDAYRENPYMLDLQQARINSIAYSNQLSRALDESESSVATAPGNSRLRLQRAQLYRWNGWPRRAEQDYALLETQDSDNLGVQAARIRADLEDGEYRKASERRRDWRERQPLQTTREYLDQRYRTELGPYLYARIDAGSSRGGNAQASRELGHELTLYSAAYTDWNDTRLFATQRGRYGRFDGVSGSILRQGLGVAHRQRDWDGQLLFSNRIGGPLGVAARGRYRPDDHWQLEAGLQSDSDALPIRAAEADIDARSANLALQYQFRSRHVYRIAAETVDFSDDNRRDSLVLTGRQGLYHNLPHGFDLRQSLYFTQNKQSNTPYFSPERQSSVMLHLDYEGLLFARFDQRWTHRLSVGAGASQQRGFGSDPIADLNYEHRYRRDRHLEGAIGVGLARRAYDGGSENSVSAYAELLWRFH